MARLLVVDDDETLLSTLELILLEAGHNVAIVPDGLEAAKLFHAKPFDVIITDLVMPNREGLETIVALRRDFPAVAIIAMSGGVDQSKTYLQLAAKLGAHRTLAKPFTPQALHGAIAAVLSGDRSSVGPAGT